MEREVETEWLGNLSFESKMDVHRITVDAHPDFGGENNGPSPENLLLAALNSCAGMDITSLLQKMRVEVDKMKISATGELTSDHPRHFRTIHLVYEFSGKHLRREKIKEAVDLSQDRYCGISHMLAKITNVTYDVIFREKQIPLLVEQ
ncbi:MAG: OsmC family protein [Cyclobacteriaceae bacterium]